MSAMTRWRSTAVIRLRTVLLACLFLVSVNSFVAAAVSGSTAPNASQSTPPGAGDLGQGQGPSPKPAATRPKYLRAIAIDRVKPEYTPEALAAGLQGSVVLYLEVSAEGTPETARVIQSLGLGLDEKAIDAVKQWRFQPATLEGKPIPIAQSVEVHFVLDPATPWWIHRLALTLEHPRFKEVNQLPKPVLIHYVSPAAEACSSSGDLVIATLRVTKQGKPEQVVPVQGQGGAAGDAALKAISSWEFRPGSINGKPTEAAATIEMRCGAAERFAAATSLSGEPAVPVVSPGGRGVPPAILYKVEPEYSVEARKARLQGTVVILAVTDPHGRAVEMIVVRRLASGLDAEAMEALNQWRFRPGMKDGKPVSTEATIEVNFRLL
jgi:TonB family protein